MDVVPVGDTLSLVQSYRKWLLRWTQLLSTDCSVRDIATSTPNPTVKILKNFPGMDQGIGRLKKLAVNLHADKNVPRLHTAEYFFTIKINWPRNSSIFRSKISSKRSQVQLSVPLRHSAKTQESRWNQTVCGKCEMQTRQYPQNGQGFGGFFA